MTRWLAAVSFILLCASCANPDIQRLEADRLARIQRGDAEVTWVPDTLRRKVAFDHRCPVGQVRILRGDYESRTVDLDACGSARRYQAVMAHSMPDGVAAWLDVTNLYSAEAAGQH